MMDRAGSASSGSGSSSSTSRSRSNDGSTSRSPSCAACKQLRRRCSPHCEFAPFFPSTAYQDFLNAHKLFGAGNILKSLKKLNNIDEKKSAAKSMIYQATARARDPVGGCYRIICQLMNQVTNLEMELQIVKDQIAIQRGLSRTSSIYSNNNNNNAIPTLQSIGGFQENQQVQDDQDVEGYRETTTGARNIEGEEFLSPSSEQTSGVLSIAAGKQQPALEDVSHEDIKPFLGGLVKKDEGSFLVGL